MSNMPLDTFLSLKRTAILSIAKGFWELPHVKKRVLTFVKDSAVDTYHLNCRRNWRKLSEKLLSAWNTHTLPLDLEGHLLHVIKEVGRRIFNWSEYIKWQKIYLVEETYTAEEVAMFVSSIRWTPCGIVDEFKTYQILSEMNPNFDIVELYRGACLHAMEEQINYLWRRMSESKRKSLEYATDQNNDCMVAYWKYRRDNNLDALEAFFGGWKVILDDISGENKIIEPYLSKPYDENISVDENMIVLSIQQGLINSVKYFWDRIPEDHRNTKLFDYLHLTLMLYVDHKPSNKSLAESRKERWVRVYVLLISQMNDNHRKLFQKTTTAGAIFEKTHKINVSRMNWLLRPAWPWHNFISLGLKDLIQRRKFPTRLAYFLLCELTRREVEQFKEGMVVNGSEIQRLVQEIWESIPNNQKEYVITFRKCSPDYKRIKFVFSLEVARDFETLRMIVNDPRINDVRYHLVNDVLENCGSLVKTGDFQLLEELINQLAKSSEERLSFRKRVDCLKYFIKRDKYDLFDKFVDWQCSEPQSNECEKIVHVIELKEHFKEKFPLDEWVFAIWIKYSKNIDEAMQRSSRFVNWVCLSKFERDHFIEHRLVAVPKSFLRKFEFSTEVIKKFYCWCELAQKEPFYNHYEIN